MNTSLARKKPQLLLGLFSLVWCLVVVSAHADVKGVTFVNSTSKLLYVRAIAGTGTCADDDMQNPKPIRQTFSLVTGESKAIPALGSDNTLCYVAGRHENLAGFIFYCGTAKGGERVEFNADDVAKGKNWCSDKIMKRTIAAKVLKYSGQTLNKIAALANATDSFQYVVSIATWNDPLTPPQTENLCIGNASGHWPWSDNWSFCNQWELQCNFMQDQALLTVDGPPGVDAATLQNSTNMCLQNSAVAAALAGAATAIVTGPGAVAAAEQAFQDVFGACMVSALSQNVGVSFSTQSHWTGWGSC